MKPLGLQSSCRGGKCNTSTPKAPGQRHQHVVGVGSNLEINRSWVTPKVSRVAVGLRLWSLIIVVN